MHPYTDCEETPGFEQSREKDEARLMSAEQPAPPVDAAKPIMEDFLKHSYAELPTGASLYRLGNGQWGRGRAVAPYRVP